MTKSVPAVLLGGRSGAHAHHFITDLASRLSQPRATHQRGHKPYLEAVESDFGADVAGTILRTSGATD